MGSVLERFLSGGRKLSAYLPRKYESQIKEELLDINIKRERILAVVLSIFLIIIIISMLLADNQQTIDKYVSRSSIPIHFTLIIFSLSFLVQTHPTSYKLKTNINKMNMLHKLIVFIVIILCSMIAVNNEALSQRPFAYIIAMYSIASMLILNEKERYIAYLSSYLVYILGCVYFLGISWRVLESLIFSFPLLVLALVVSSINYSAYVQNFINQKLIQQKNIELDAMYKKVDEVLSLRTEQLNHAIEVDKLRVEFFMNISHELRTPLNVIYSAEQMLNMVCRDQNIQNRRSELLKYNNMVQVNCYRLIRLIDNLIDIAEISSGQTCMNFRKHDIERLVKTIVSATAEYMKDRKTKLEFSCLVDNKLIICDGEKIERIILNLLSNAIKFTPEGGNIKVSLYEKAGKTVISVRDTGIGIPKEMEKLIFDPFVRVDESISRLREGSGVGLAIVKAFVELHKGEIKITSEEGQGSEFIVELPIDLAASTEVSDKIMTDYKCHEKVKMEFSDFYN